VTYRSSRNISKKLSLYTAKNLGRAHILCFTDLKKKLRRWGGLQGLLFILAFVQMDQTVKKIYSWWNTHTHTTQHRQHDDVLRWCEYNEVVLRIEYQERLVVMRQNFSSFWDTEGKNLNKLITSSVWPWYVIHYSERRLWSASISKQQDQRLEMLVVNRKYYITRNF
jgi:hypothetical protein